MVLKISALRLLSLLAWVRFRFHSCYNEPEMPGSLRFTEI